MVGRGLVAVLLGLIAFFMPGATMVALISVFAAYALIHGIATLAIAFTHREPGDSRWWMLIVEGLAGLAVAALVVFRPGVTSLALLYVIGAWGLITGVLEIAAAIRLRHVIRNEWLLALSGVLSIVFGVIMFRAPAIGALAIVYTVGIYALLFGGTTIGLGLRLRRLERRGEDLRRRIETGVGGGVEQRV
jgi:uncharacterized membrane protein HdeD (DUF308 family)